MLMKLKQRKNKNYLGYKINYNMYTRLQTKTAQKPYPMGRHIPVWLTSREYPPGHDFEEMIRDQVLTLNGSFIGLISPLCDLKSELILQRREILKPLQTT